MSGKLDQSLDEILKTTRRPATRRGRGGRRVPNTPRTTAVAPVGGVKKNTVKQPKGKNASIPSGPALANKESKVIISNFVSLSHLSRVTKKCINENKASDVNENMIKVC